MKILADFRALILRPTLLDMALGVVIGGAFLRVIQSLISDIVMPVWTLNYATFKVGFFIETLFQFGLVAVSVFLIWEAINRAGLMHAPDTKECPYCRTKMHPMASKCPSCATQLHNVGDMTPMSCICGYRGRAASLIWPLDALPPITGQILVGRCLECGKAVTEAEITPVGIKYRSLLRGGVKP